LLTFELLVTSCERFFKVTVESLIIVDELHTVKVTLLTQVAGSMESSYLVDPASSHMLVSKIKPCMSKYKQICTVKLRMAH
jgi:hypothetical protein